MRSIASEYGWEDYRQTVRDSVKADPALFEKFVGEFSVSNITLRIHRDGSRLYVAGPPIGSSPVELIPAGDYDYFVREKNVTLHFDANGSAPVATLTFVDGKPRPGKRIAGALKE